MTDPFLGEIRMVAFNFAPKGWALCNGQTMAINQNQALFSLLGTTYGGNGTTTFQLPDLQARAPLHFGAGINQGVFGGEAAHQLTQAEMPNHVHPVSGRAAAAVGSPQAALWAASAKPVFATSPDGTTMASSALAQTGGNQPHDNMPPYLVLNFAIAVSGIFPSRN